MSQALDNQALGQLFTEARTHNGWQDRPITDDDLHRLYDLVKIQQRFAFVSKSTYLKLRL